MIDKPVPGVQTVARAHPAGEKGALMSLKEVGERAWKARMSPRVRAWATQELAKCGASTGNHREKASCILNAFRKKVPYVKDPVMGEFIATPDQTLCLDEGGLCIVGGDCDDASVTLAAAMMSIGIPAMIIGSSHKEPFNVPSHVYIAFQDEFGKWIRMDGTTRHPIGQAPPAMREFWFEPGKEAKESGSGDFVGMSGTLEGAPSMLDLLYPTIC